MVLDEELKMMAAVAEHGGQVVGPYLKEMAHLAHTEYLLAGRGSRDVREVLRETMFAPTVTGSPMRERLPGHRPARARAAARYYAGVLALLGHDEQGRQTLDAPILIRTAEISPDGRAAGAGRRHAGAALDRRRRGGRDARQGRRACWPRSGCGPDAPAPAPEPRRARRRPGGTRRAGRPQRRRWPGSGWTQRAPGRAGACPRWPADGR